MIQDIAPHQLHIGYELRRDAEGHDFAVAAKDGELLVDEHGCIPTFDALGLSPMGAQYLFTMDTDAYYMVDADANDAAFHFAPSSSFRTVEPRYCAFAGITAFQLVNFYRRNRFCSTCAHPLEHHKNERALVCPECGRIVYPRISPAVIAAVVDGDLSVLNAKGNTMIIFDGAIFNAESFSKKMHSQKAGTHRGVLLIKADKNVDTQTLLDICSAARAGGFEKIHLAATPEEK